MKNDKMIYSLSRLGEFLNTFVHTHFNDYTEEQKKFYSLIKQAETANSWYTEDNLKFCFKHWGQNLTKEKITQWLKTYCFSNEPKKVGLILAGNIPMVGFHDIVCVILSGHIPIIKLSSKDQKIIPFLLNKWKELSDNSLDYIFVEKLEDYDAVIATGSNNTARYLEHYFEGFPNIIRKNRTSIGILKGDETDKQIKLLAEDIFRYFGLGCRNVTKLMIPKNMNLNRLFENFIDFKEIIHHNQYANNYDYNRAVYLLNQEKFWDNNFVMLKEDEKLFSPLGVIHFSRYQDENDIRKFIATNESNIQCIVANPELNIDNTINFGESQNPELNTYADNVDTMNFLSKI